MTTQFVWILLLHIHVLGNDLPMYIFTYDSEAACKQDISKMDAQGKAASECVKEPVLGKTK